MKKVFDIEVDCGHCALKMEEAVKATAGVKDAVMKAARKNCKKVESDCEIFLD